jgi:hypothetical protein
MKYVRNEAPPELRLRFHIRDKFGSDIFRALDYDTDTGIGHCYSIGSDKIIEFFKPQGYVEVDGHVNPSQQVLDSIYNNTQSILNPQIMAATVNKITTDERFTKGFEENNPQPQEPVPEPQEQTG